MTKRISNPPPPVENKPPYFGGKKWVVTQYYYREIGESNWLDCNKAWFEHCTTSPLHDTKLIHEKHAERVKAGEA